MASLASLKRNMYLTITLIFGVLFALVSAVTWYMGSSIYVSIFFALFIVFLQWLISPSIVAWSTKLQYLKPGENTFLETTVRELAEKSNIPMPRLAVVPDQTPNAFVFGRTRGSSTLAVHQGLLGRLNQDEVRAVLAHEVGHLKHNDSTIMTFASAVPLIAYMVARSFMFARGGGKKAGQAIIVGLFSYVIYFLAQLLVMSLSRSREFYADAYSAFVTDKPHDLSSALAKITYGLSLSKEETSGLRAFYIGDPSSAKREISDIRDKAAQYDLNRDGILDARELELAMEQEAKSRWASANELFSTHPPTFKRIAQLATIEEEIRQGGFEKNIYRTI